MRFIALAAALSLPAPAMASDAECQALQRTMERVAGLAETVSQAAQDCRGSDSKVCLGIENARQTLIDDGLLEPAALGGDMMLMLMLSVELCD